MEFADLVQAVQSLKSDDAFGARLDKHQWRALASYLTVEPLRVGHCLFRQGERKRSVYFLGEGHLQVTADDGVGGNARTELLRPGAMIGESGLFCDEPHLATVEAMTPVTVWMLSLPRFEELSQRLPVLALEVMRGAGAVMTARQRLALARSAVHALARTAHQRGNLGRAHTAPSQSRVTLPADLAA